MTDRSGIFAGNDPFEITRRWLTEAGATEPSDPNAMALATVDGNGLPNVRIVLLKEIEPDAFVFYTNYESAKGQEIEAQGTCAFVLHWKSLARQIRVRGPVAREDGGKADAYFLSRSPQSRIGAIASRQSRPLASRDVLEAEVSRIAALEGAADKRPAFWGGYRIRPLEMEFWSDGAYRLHDRFRWSRATVSDEWKIERLNP